MKRCEIVMNNIFIVLHAMFMFVSSTIIAFLGILGVSAAIYNVFLSNRENIIYEDYQNHIIKPVAKRIMTILFYVLPVIIGFAYTILSII